MNKLITIIGALAVGAAATASGEDFPLTFRTIPAKDVMSFPGGSGSYGQLGLAKPDQAQEGAQGRVPASAIWRVSRHVHRSRLDLSPG